MVTALVGGQFGSEGKGLIAAHVAKDYDVHVRVGAANAGHTFYTEDGKPDLTKHVVQQLPCAAFANPMADVVLGAGAMIDTAKLTKEIQKNTVWRRENGWPRLHLRIDRKAHVVTEQWREAEQVTDLAARIGSTSTIAREGIGAAQAAKVLRDRDCMVMVNQHGQGGANVLETLTAECDYDLELIDTAAFLDVMRRGGSSILLEGTQGTGLSLTHGFFPFTTSRDTTAAGLASDCGIAPRHIDDVIGVFRTYPIRVAGNSGPFYPESHELSFGEIGVEPELTTVTKLERRIASFSFGQVEAAHRLNGFTRLAITFADYLQPNIYESETDLDIDENLGSFLSLVEDVAPGAPIHFIGTGPHSVIDLSDRF